MRSVSVKGLPKEWKFSNKRLKEIEKLIEKVMEETKKEETLIKDGLKRMTVEELLTLRDFLKVDLEVGGMLLLILIRKVLKGKR